MRYLFFLLLLSGDIETNPGPPFELVSANLSKILNLLVSASIKWFELGLQLGLKEIDLKVIECDRGKDGVQVCFREMISMWLKMINPKPSWEGLIAALKKPSVQLTSLAKEIRKECLTPEAEMDEHSATSSSDCTVPSIPESVQRDIEILEDLFGVLSDRTFDIIQSQNISVDVFKARLSNLSVRNKKLHREFLGFMLTRSDGTSTLGDIWTRLNLYCNFLNYSLMEHLVKKFGDETLRTDFQEFKEQLRAFRCKTRLCDVAKYLRDINHSLSKQELKLLEVKLNKRWRECTLEDIETSKHSIAKKFFIPTYFLNLMEGKPGSISIMCTIPDTIAAAIKQKMDHADIVEFCKAQGIISLCIEEQEYEYLDEKVEAINYPVTTTESDAVVDSFAKGVQNYVVALEDAFAEIEQSTLEHILHKNAIGDFMSGLANLPIKHREVHENFFEQIYSEINLAMTITNVWERLSTYWNFYNCTLFQEIVYEFGDKFLKFRMNSYLKELKEFQGKTLLSDFAKHSIMIGANLPNDFTELTIKLLEICDMYKLEDLEKLTENITEDFFLPKFLLVLKDIEPSGLGITWAVPTMIANSLKENMGNTDMMSFCKGNFITSITIAGEECRYSAILKYTSYLKDIYSAKKGKNLAPFELAIIKKERKLDEFTKSTLRGDQDDILVYSKHPIEEGKVGHPTQFSNYEQPRLILIEGAPGVGKTTFSEQFCYKWSKGQLLKKHKLLVLLPLRDNKVKSSKSVNDLFQCPQLQQTVAQEVESCEGEGVALWLEAWDELEEGMREKSSLFLDLVHGRVLPKATVIITSRPWATKKLREDSNIKLDQHVEIIATPKIQFSRILREERVRSDAKAKFIDYTYNSPSMKAAMHTPVTANIVTEVFQWSRDTESSPPATMTQLYTAYTCKLIMQHLSIHKNESYKIKSLEDIPENSRKIMLELSRLAWEGTVEQQLTFSSSDVAGDTLGLMEGVRELYGGECGQFTYHFIHLTLQEFLSAYHITQLPQDRQEQVIQQHFSVEHLKMVVRFYFGLTKHHDFASGMVAEHMSEAAAYHWMFEAGDPDTITEKLEPGEVVEVKSAYEWTPLDYYVVGYCIANFNVQWKVDFSASSPSDEDMELWYKGLISTKQAEKKGMITSLDFSNDDIALEHVKWLVNIPLNILGHLHTMDLSCNGLDSIALGQLCKVISQLTNLQKLDLSNNPIENGGAVQTLKCLCNHKIPLKTLNLTFSAVGEEDCALLPELNKSTILETLWIDGNYLTLNSVTSIMRLLQSNTIQDLGMSHSQFSEEHSLSLASLLQQPDCQLRKLDIQECSITEEGAVQLAAALTHNNSLTVLEVSWNTIKDNGAVAFGQMLMHNTVLRKLNMQKCGVTSKGAVQLAIALSGNTTLQSLSIGRNQIGIEGAEAVSKMIEENHTLETLELHGDNSLGEGAALILASLQKNSTIKTISLHKAYKSPAYPKVKWR